MKDGFLKVGVASVDVEVANPIHNKEKVMEVIKKADKNGVKLLVFPELVLTAYTCNDLFLQKTLPVSYTHLDVYKRQLYEEALRPYLSDSGEMMITYQLKESNEYTLSLIHI